MASSNGILRQLERKAEIAVAAPERHSAIRQLADNISRKNIDKATCEYFSEAVQRLTLLAYERDDAGYCNIDGVTWKLLIPAPWGRAGHRRWAITRTESDILRAMIFARQAQTPSRPPGLWLYDRERKSWRANLYDYDRVSDAQAYWRRWPLSVPELRQAREQMRSR